MRSGKNRGLTLRLFDKLLQNGGGFVIFSCNSQRNWRFLRIFAPKMKQELRRHIASWLLLAVFVPMLVLSSVHIHDEVETITTECADCVHHNCHGHIAAMTTWAHDCVLCQFLTLTMLTAAIMVCCDSVATDSTISSFQTGIQYDYIFIGCCFGVK